MSRLVGDGIPLSRTGRTGYRMVAQQYTGHVLYVVARTPADVRDWLPGPLQTDDPHLLFLKLYALKRRDAGGDFGPPGYWQYHEACITILARLGHAPPRHYNLFMWVDRDWATWKAREVFGWPKKVAQIDQTLWEPAPTGHWDRDESGSYRVHITRWGYPVLDVEAVLGQAGQFPLPPLNGFFGLRRIPAPEGGATIEEITAIDIAEGWSGEPVWGTASVQLYDGPDEELSLLGPLEVRGCSLRQVRWVLPANPARIVARAEFGVMEGARE